MSDRVTRFSLRQRIEHFAVMVLFIVLATTGLSQKFFDASVARWLIAVMGGITWVQWIHRSAGILFSCFVIEHFSVELFRVTSGRASASMVPTRRDFRDAIVTMRYYLRLSDEQARFDRFDYRQKFEYWGLVLGGMVIIATGFMLLFPVETARFLPGEFIPAAKIAHSNEGLLAFLVIITWHIYNAHFSPEVFPFDPSIFTGKVKRERMEKEHPLEYERMVGTPAEERQEAAAEPAAAADAPGVEEEEQPKPREDADD
jgi:formate dehydrogenase subunit gamma